MDNKVIRTTFDALDAGNVPLVKQLMTKHPGLLDFPVTGGSWLHNAAKTGKVAMAHMLVDLGADVNKCSMPEEVTPLISAIFKGHLDVARFLLSRGADVKIGRSLISAINVPSEDLALEFVKLLVEHGADVNQSFNWYGDDSVTYTPLTWAAENGKTEIAAYMSAHGARKARKKAAAHKPEPANLADEVVAYFGKHFGPVRPKALMDIVPTGVPVGVRVVPPGDGRDNITLFTTGLSQKPLDVPKGKEEYQFCELFIQLPREWKLTADALADPKYAWPIRWLRRIAKYPYEHDTWLGGPLTIVANGEPPKRLAAGIPFTCVMLLAEHSFESAGGHTVQLYRLVPLFTEERDLERQRGSRALMKALDRHDVPLAVDVSRPNVGLG